MNVNPFQTLFVLKLYLSKSCYLLGKLLIRGFQWKTTWLVSAWFLQVLCCAQVVAERRKLLIIFLWNPLSLVEFGLLFCIGWEYITQSFAFIPWNFAVHICIARIFVISYRWFGWLLYESFGRSVSLKKNLYQGAESWLLTRLHQTFLLVVKEQNLNHLLDCIKLFSLRWLKSQKPISFYDFHSWWKDPFDLHWFCHQFLNTWFCMQNYAFSYNQMVWI